MSGHIFPIAYQYASNIYKYVDNFDWFVLTLELILCLFIAYFIVEEVHEVIY